MTKKIFSGLFILTAAGAVAIIIAGAVSEGDQLPVRFLSAVVVLALMLYVISDIRLQASRSRKVVSDTSEVALSDLLKESEPESETTADYAASVLSSREFESVGASTNTGHNSIGYDLAELEDLRDSLNSYEPTDSFATLDEGSEANDDLVAIVNRTTPSDDQFAWPQSGETPRVEIEEFDDIVDKGLVESVESAIDEFDQLGSEPLTLVENESLDEEDLSLTAVGGSSLESVPDYGDLEQTEKDLNIADELAGVEPETIQTVEDGADADVSEEDNFDDAAKAEVEAEEPEVEVEEGQVKTEKVEVAKSDTDDTVEVAEESAEVDLELVSEIDIAGAAVEQDIADSVSDDAVEEVIDLTSEQSVEPVAKPVDLSAVIDLRESDVVEFQSSLDEAIALGETTVVETLIEQGMLTTDGPITDRDVRTMVYVAFTSNELRKLIRAGGVPGVAEADYDLGPVELFDETRHAPAPKRLYKGQDVE